MHIHALGILTEGKAKMHHYAIVKAIISNEVIQVVAEPSWLVQIPEPGCIVTSRSGLLTDSNSTLH